MRKFSELPFQLVRCYRYKDLYDHVLFNYRWLFAKMSALPLHEVLGDFDDAVNLIEDPKDKKEINLVADSIRLGGAILKYYPEMLASQLNGRLLPERQNCRNVRSLLRQCDEVGIHQNALVPAFHCMHTPGGPLKYSMEGHQFAIFSMRLTSDYRYIVSVSNKFITFDVVTSDLTRQVYPAVEGLFLDLQLSADNKFAAAFTNNNETVLLNTLVSEFIVIPNPFPDPERGSKVEGAVQVRDLPISLSLSECKFQGLALLDNCLVIWGHQSWVVYNMAGQEKGRRELPEGRSIRALRLETVERARIVTWSGDPDNPDLALQSVAEEGWGPPLSLHTAFALSASLNLAFLCENTEDFTISSHR